ncbi:tandem-95 repeat protein [Catalinimonas niigatensis]|uniref:tandem-95 repeat protein n=1 Tax=Catalinimonas niigatensis TaxID=1397264 RepID=UPI002665219E|nr:tandem-95 repeat protein [Catalinimonas niigatensis]WPP50132.1 tandem-95 repeat protein [Catalinimonas niigatensis]
MRTLHQQISLSIFFLWAFLCTSVVLAQGSPPNISNVGNGTINYQEGGDPVALAGSAVIEDSDSPNMMLATFSFGGTYNSAQDTLLFIDTEDIKSHFDETSGTLRLLSASANDGVSLGQMQSALNSVQYRLTSDNPTNRTLAVNIQVTDAEGNESSTASRSINVSATNDAPQISSNSTASQSIINQDIRIFEDVEITDPDNTQLTRVEIEFVEGFNSPEDRLFLRGVDGGLTREENTAQRIVLSGTADIGTYEDVILSFFYGHQPLILRTAGIRRINLRVYDSNNGVSNTLSHFFVVQPIFGARINLPPSVGNFSVQTNEDNNYTFEASEFNERFDDPNGGDLAGIIIGSLPESGRLFLGNTEINNQFIINRTQIAPNQIPNLSYRPAAGFSGSDQFSWNATDQESFAANDAQVFVRVIPVNQQPVLNLPANVEVEEDEATAISGISLTDPDQDEVTVTVSVDDGTLFLSPIAVEGEFIDFISGTENGEDEITFSGPSTLAAFALSGLTYQPNDGFSGEDELTVEVDDDNGGTASGSTVLNVLLINDAPVLANLESSNVSYTENGNPARVTGTITVSDEENNQITSATVAITEGFAEGQDILDFDDQDSNVEGDYNEETGVLSLSGSATTSVYQNILRSITYVNNSNNPSTEERVISFTVTDNGEPATSSETVSRSLQVTAVNDAPVLANLESSPISYDILDNDPVAITNALTITDVDNDNLRSAVISFEENYNDDEDLLSFSGNGNISGSWDDDEGVLTLSGNATVAQYQQAIRSVRYQNIGEEDDEDDEVKEISIRVSDGSDNSNTLSREINIITNDPPVVTSFSKTINEDAPLSFAVADFPYEDPDNGPSQGLQSIAITALPANGVLVVAEDTITAEDVENSAAGFGISAAQISELRYLPLPDSSGTDSFEWNAFDGAEYAEEVAQVSITITAQPDAPVPSSFSAETPEDQAYTFTAQQFVNNAPDPDGDPLAGIIIRTVPENGSLRLNNVALPANSELSLQEINNLRYLPNENYNGEDAFSWAATDGTLVSEQSAQVLIAIIPVNDAPIINNFTRAIGEAETSYNFVASDFTENYLDIENTPLNFIQITSLPARGTLLLNGTAIEAGVQINAENIANLQYQAAADQEVGIIRFGWNASDGTDLAANAAQVTIIIGTGVTNFSISTNEDTEYNFSRSQFTNNYGNPDPEASLQIIRIEALPQNGTLLLNEENVNVNQEISAADLNQLTYLPNENYFGEDSLTWNASDGGEFTAEAANVLITVASVNDLPIIQPVANINLLAGTTSEPISITIDDQETNVEELTLTASSSNQEVIPAEQITLAGNGANRTVTLSAPPDIRSEVVITLTVSDGEEQTQQQFTVNVVPYVTSFDIQDTLELCVGETATVEVSIDIEPEPGSDTTSYTLISECDQGDCALDYSNGIITLSPSVSATYYLSVEDASGIRSNVDTLTVNIIDCTNIALEIPTAFTPDGDQVNDMWEIENIQYATNVLVEVFDRYGRNVFRSEGYQQAWDGTSENAMLPVGTYYYVIIVDGGLQSYKGSVTILR